MVRPPPDQATVYYVYILASGRYGTLYVGVTNDIARRIHEHHEGLADGFTKRYGIKTLVYVEVHATALDTIAREKTLKRWRRAWKIELIERDNPIWSDLYERVL